MRLNKIKIENFRGIESLEVDLERDITVFIGENNSGKTSVLEALRFGLNTIKSGKICNFSEYDFYRNEERNSLSLCNPIVLTFIFLESEEHLWPAHIVQALNNVIVGADHAAIKLQLTAKYNPDNAELTQGWCFLDDADREMVGKHGSIKDLRQLRPFFFQSALRAAKDEFYGQSTYWSSFVKNKNIDNDTKEKLGKELFDVNQKIVDAHLSFKDVTEEIKRISELVLIGSADPVSVDPAPSDVYKSLRDAEVNLLSGSKAKIPIRNHGEGTQSLSVLLLFSAYLKTRLKADIDKLAEPIIAIEEPEAHLHPNATRSTWHLLKTLPGQKIIATHSGDILSEVPIENIRCMHRTKTSIECKSIPVGLLDSEEHRKFNHHVRRNRGELLFAKIWLLVEGETDVTVLIECADILGINLHQRGIRIVEYSQSDQNIFIKVADALGINWFFVADGDDEGNKYIKAAKKHLNGRNEQKHIYQIKYDNIETLLCMNGYGQPYIKRIDENKKANIIANGNTSEYWSQVYKSLKNKSKPAAALEATLLIRKKGKDGVPQEIIDILNKPINLTEYDK